MKSLKIKIIIPVILLITLGFITFSYSSYCNSKNAIIDRYKTISQEKADRLAISIEQDMGKWKGMINFLSTLDCTKTLNYSKLYEYISSNSNLFSDFDTVWIANLNGNYTDLYGNTGNVSNKTYFNKAINGETTVSKPILSQSTNNPVITISAPILDENNIINGVISATVDLSYITDHITSENNNDYGYAFMIDSDGLLISHPNNDIVFTYDFKKNKDATLVSVIEKMQNREEGTEYYIYQNQRKMVSYKPLKSVDWSIAISIVYSDMIASLDHLKRMSFLVTLLFVILNSLLLYYLVTTIIKPIDKLKNYMEIAAAGNLSIQSDIDTNDEISALSNSFNALVKQNKNLLEKTMARNKEQNIFFSNISHELRTPLNLIFSTNQLMSFYIKDKNFSVDKFGNYINIIKQNSYRLLRLVNNLIDITEINSNFTDLNLKNRNIVQVIEDITLSTVSYVENQSKTIIFDTEIEEKIMAFDTDMMERMLLNLISNAIKFTEANDTIEVNILDKGENIIISVKDSGIGIPEDKQKLIFDRFAQVDTSLARAKEGSGIGLNLVKSIVEKHDGTISLKSKIHEGSEFIIELPVKLIDDENNYSDYILHQPTKVDKVEMEFSDIYETKSDEHITPSCK